MQRSGSSKSLSLFTLKQVQARESWIKDSLYPWIKEPSLAYMVRWTLLSMPYDDILRGVSQKCPLTAYCNLNASNPCVRLPKVMTWCVDVGSPGAARTVRAYRGDGAAGENRDHMPHLLHPTFRHFKEELRMS